MTSLNDIAIAAHTALNGLFLGTQVSETTTELASGEVPCLVVGGSFMMYPVKATKVRRTIGGLRESEVTQWQVDRLVDDSDPSVGMYGTEPVEWTLCESPWEAIAEIGAEMARHRIEGHLEAEAEAKDYIEVETVPEPVLKTLPEDYAERSQQIISFLPSTCIRCEGDIARMDTAFWVRDFGLVCTKCGV